MSAPVRYRSRSEFGERLSGRRVMVTGASGFLGSHLCETLVELGAVVHAVSRSAHPGTTPTGTSGWPVDVTDRVAVAEAVTAIRPEFVFHLAGVVTATPDPTVLIPSLQSHVLGTVHLLLALHDTACERIVLVRSAEEAPGEALDAAVSSPYGAAKTAATVYGHLFRTIYGLPVVFVRPKMGYGPRQDRRKLVPYVITSLLRGEPPLLSHGSRVCDFVYVMDVVRGLLGASLNPRLDGETVELGSGQGTSVREVAEVLVDLCRSTVRPVYGALPDRPEQPMANADREATRRLIGWDPVWSLEAGLIDTLAWYQRHPH